MVLFPESEVTADFNSLNQLWHGWPGTGKTTLASLMGGGKLPPLFLATEKDQTKKMHRQMITDWAHFERIIKYLENNIQKLKEEHSCLVIDLITDLDLMCQKSIEQEKNVSYLHDLDFGKGSALHKGKMQPAVLKLFNLLPTIFLAHSRERELNWNGEKLKVQAPDLAKGTMDFISGKCDIIAYIGPANDKKLHGEFVTQGSTKCLSKSRFPALLGTYPLIKNEPELTIKALNEAFTTEKDK